VKKLTNVLSLGLITFEEYALNVLQAIIAAQDTCWDECVGLVPTDVLGQFVRYVDEYLVPVDFMPSPTAFMTRITDSECEKKKRELRPRYVRFHHSLHAYFESVRPRQPGEKRGPGSTLDT
jgi:hypothetical protein